MPDIDYRALAEAALELKTGARMKAVGAPTTTYGHGPGGLFSTPGLSRPVFSALVTPRLGLQAALRAIPTRNTNPLFGIITGVTATTGSEPTNVCDDPPTAGLAELCQHQFLFGRQSRQTRVFDLSRIGKLVNRGEFTDLQLFGDLFAKDNPNVPTLPGATGGSNALNTEMAKALFEYATTWSRDFAREIYTGNPANNTAGGGRKYFYGLDMLLNTGYVDAETNILCPAADSIVTNMNYLLCDDSSGTGGVNVNGPKYVKVITNIYRNLKYRAVRAGLNPVKIVLTMRWSMFYQITEIWPQAYHTYRNVVSLGGQTVYLEGEQLTKFRDDMRGDLFGQTGQYLLIDGEKVEVICDDAITETDLGLTQGKAGQFASNIYFVPMEVLGGMPVTYLEHFDYDAPGGAMEAARAMAADMLYYTSDGGRFFWHRKPPVNWCVQLVALTEPRLLALTPYLGARLTNAACSPFLHEASPFTDEGYFVDGGVSDRNALAPSYYAP